MTDQQSLVILYASETGTAEEVAFKLHRTLSQRNLSFSISSLEDYDVSRLPSETCIIWVVATAGEGEVPGSMKKFWNFLLRRSLSRDSLKGVSTAVFGLGDSSYEKFNAAARRLKKRLEQLGSSEIIPIGLGDDQSKFGYFTELDSWVAKLLPILQKYSVASVAAAGNVPSSSKEHYRVTVLPDAASDPAVSAGVYKQPSYSEEELQQLHSYFVPPDLHKQHRCQRIGTGTESGITPSLPIVAVVKSNTRMTAASWTQDVRHVVMRLLHPLEGVQGAEGIEGAPCSDVSPSVTSATTATTAAAAAAAAAATSDVTHHSAPISSSAVSSSSSDSPGGISLIAGDVATVYPSNDPLLVSRMLAVLNKRSGNSGSNGNNENAVSYYTDTMIKIKPVEAFVKRRSRVSDIGCLSLGRLFSSVLDIAGIPQRGFFEGLANYTEGEEKEKLLEISSAEGTDLYYDYCLKERRSYVEVMEDFHTAKPSLSQLLELIPLLQPRHYSIANSGLVQRDVVHLCVAVVATKTPYGRERTGVCSQYLRALVPGDQVMLWVRSGALKLPPLAFLDIPLEALKIELKASYSASRAVIEDIEETISSVRIPKLIMVGPGTGVAPMRALVQERKMAHERIAALRSMIDPESLVSLEDSGNSESGDSSVGSVSSLLFFGCRGRGNDFLYGDEWQALCGDHNTPNNGTLNIGHDHNSTLGAGHNYRGLHNGSPTDIDSFHGASESVVVAFSRDQKEKVYVTDKIKQYGQLVWTLLQEGAYVFISGSAKRMPSDVKTAIKAVITTHGQRTEEEASAMLLQMERRGRYVVEAWS